MIGFVRRSLTIIEGVDVAAYKASCDTQELLELNMLHLGEAAARVSEELKATHPEIPWHEMIGLRNLIAHEYFRINPMILFETAVKEFASLESKLVQIQSLFPTV